MKKIGIFLADGFEEIEGLTVVDILRRAGLEAVTISVMGKKEIVGSHKICVLADALYEDTDFSGLDGVVLPGGLEGTTNLGKHEGVCGTARAFTEEGKLVAAICAAPSVLGQEGILKGWGRRSRFPCAWSLTCWMRRRRRSLRKKLFSGSSLTQGFALAAKSVRIGFLNGKSSGKEEQRCTDLRKNA